MAELAVDNRMENRRSLIKLKTVELDIPDSDSEEESDEEFFDKEKIKKKFTSAWNNVKYGFNMSYKPSFSEEKPIWLLGRCYHCRSDISSNTIAKPEHMILSIDQFFEDFSSLIWLTYRKHFSQLANSTLTSDGGWGCMLRTGQMLLANAILVHMLKGGWRQSQRVMSYEKNYIYRMIIQFFNDESSLHSPFSLHELVRLGEGIGKKAGDWYGPSTVAYALRNAVNGCSHLSLETFRVYVSRDCTIYKEDVVRVCTKCKSCGNSSCEDKFWRSLLLLVPIRLGTDALNPIYIPCLQGLLANDHCIGIIGGRPKHSLYFVGFQGHKLIHLDPHYLQDKVDMTYKNFNVESFHCQYPKKMKFHKMDPSSAIGFYCRTKKDFEIFCQEIIEVLTPPLQRSEYPIFTINEGTDPNYDGNDEVDGFCEVRPRVSETDVNGRQKKVKLKGKKSREKTSISYQSDDYVVVE